MDWNIKVNYCKGFKKSEHNGLVIVANIRNGMNLKMSKQCYDILDMCIVNAYILSDFFALFEDDEDREYFKQLFEVLLRYDIVISEDKFEVYMPVLELTNRCNLRCNHCCMDAVAVTECDELSTDEWKKVIDKLAGLKIELITITGGEPMVREDFFEIAEYTKNKLNVPMQLMSNATLINENNADRLLQLFDDFSFSLDGADEESCAAVRGRGVFQRALNGIQIMKNKGMKSFSLSFTKVKQNEKSEDEFIALAKRLGATPMIRNFDVVGRAKKHLELLPTDIDEQFRPVLSDPGNPEGHYYPESMPLCVSCTAVDNKLCIAHDGSIFPCQVLMFPEFKIGNVSDIDSIAEFWLEGKQYLTDGYKKFAEVHTAHSSYCKDCEVNLFCDSCVLYTYLMKNRDNFKELCKVKKEVLMAVWK